MVVSWEILDFNQTGCFFKIIFNHFYEAFVLTKPVLQIHKQLKT